MLPITRANLQSFCRNCLREFIATETTHEIERDIIQRNRLFPQKVCYCCYIKIKTLKGFQDKANLATGVLKLIVQERLAKACEKEETEALERRLKSFCRLCLKPNNKSTEQLISTDISNDIKECTGLQIESNPIKLEKCDDVLGDDMRYSHTICVRCKTTLKGFVEYRQTAKQTIDYLQSILDDDDDDHDEEISKIQDMAKVKISPEEIQNQSIEPRSVELSCSRSNSKFVVNVIENESNELLSEQEDVLSAESSSRESIFRDNFSKEERNSTKNRASKVRKLNRKETKPQRCRQSKNVQKKRQSQRLNEAREENESMATDLSKQDEELQKEQNLQSIEKTETQNVTENAQSKDTIFKTEIAEEFIKIERRKSEEDIFRADRKMLYDDTNTDNTNSILHIHDEDSIVIPQESKQAELLKQDADFETEVEDTNYEPDEVVYESDSNSDDICLAKLISKKKKTTFSKTKSKRTTQKPKTVNRQQKPKYKCDKCNKSFFKKHTIEAHLKRHEGASKAFACKQCDRAFTTYQALQRHENMHDGKGTTLRSRRQQIAMRYKSTRECPKCHLILNRHIDLAQHIQREHNGVYVFKCKICGKCLSTQAALNRHEQNHSDERPFACQFCEKRYNYETELKVHMQRHTADPALLCPICKTARANPEELQRHIASHRKPHQCSKCGKVFTKAYSLHQHDLSVHLNLKVHKCPQCDLSFKGRKTLSLHRLHHDPTGRPETCRVCGLFFRTKRGRLRHTSKFHPNAELPPEEPSPTATDDGRNECCEKCPLRFKTKRGLKLHTKKTHEKGQRVAKTEIELKEKYGDRSEICVLCQLQCYSKKGLSRHIRKRHPDLAQAKDIEKSANRSEACVMCPLKFRTARGLLLHTKRMHRDMSVSQELKSNTAQDYQEHKLSLPLSWL